jgi:hypothetical protein|tara:strand:- start:62 stop:370 length:309 start_codon:yes stop_codon:yes gene_type:complete
MFDPVLRDDQALHALTDRHATGHFDHRDFELAIVVLSQRPEPWPGGVRRVVGHLIAVDAVEVAHPLSKDTGLAHVVQTRDAGSADPVETGSPRNVLIAAGST